MPFERLKINPWDNRRDLIVPGDNYSTTLFCTDHWISVCNQSIKDHGAFFVALSGGSTPKSIFERITASPYNARIDWSKVHLFWSDERAVAPDHPDSNYHMAMQAGLNKMPIPKEQIHRMCAEEKIEENALNYENTIKHLLKGRPFDLVMLGMGEDGHTASLFPHTQALNASHRLVVANYLPDKKTWRMTFTFECINQASHIAIYVLGANKKYMLAEVLNSSNQFDRLPSQRVGTPEHHALWIVDEAAADEILKNRPLN
jgi:6-phosphogluconolactonase